MPAWVSLIWLLMIAATIGFFYRLNMQRQAGIDAWEQSPAGTRHREALESWLLCKARVEQAEPTGEPPVFRAAFVGHRMASGRTARRYVREERRPMRLQVRLLPIGGGEVVAEAVIPIVTDELGDLTPGRIFSVLYDPRDPRRFWIDTTRRDETLIDAVTMRTRAAEDNHRAAQAFSTGQG
ncbi:hypothetical protein OV203_08390 [Nannocystis sp. ILAH1]|uniref:hypothetical protein n=1 Tax=unclassified Nannocystis TaxID=2627009 RepID=UPI00226F50C2|nr:MULTISPECIES: hypothetical protein [unclassified Nannocystis]MCY0987139.1 hypothetical protein [Nannocystis sp. ILAH1]MCY1072022.1 hypothetical protein [Nannocystis sp. RBIL2]